MAKSSFSGPSQGELCRPATRPLPARGGWPGGRTALSSPSWLRDLHRLWLALGVSGFFLAIDLAFFGANVFKITHGGWFPLVVAAGVFTLMSTWRRGRLIVFERMRELLILLEQFLQRLDGELPARVPGTAVFLFSNPHGTPPALRFNVAHNRVLHETMVILTIQTEEVPHVPVRERLRIETVRPGIYPTDGNLRLHGRALCSTRSGRHWASMRTSVTFWGASPSSPHPNEAWCSGGKTCSCG